MISAPRTDESPAAGGDPVEKSPASCPLVAIGASAGGLEALKDLFSNMPLDTEAAFVVIMRLDPNSESLIAQILGRCTTMQVAQAQEGMQVEANHVYVIPPDTSLTLNDSTFHLKELVPTHGLRMPIDTFLLSLSEDQQEKTVAVILSGNGTDGTLGLRAVKGYGGLAMAQSPESAQYGGMPRSAIATGLVDIVGPVKAMGASLDRFLHHPYIRPADFHVAVGKPAQLETDPLLPIFALLRARTGYDFAGYKRGTVGRRIARRMGLHDIDSVPDYVELLQKDPDEAMKLLKDMSIGVTAFFRDADAFQELDREVLANIVAKKRPGDPIRVWVPGCSTGEEVYSIAMLLIERLDCTRKQCPLLIFATDRDETNLVIARRGVYPEGSVVCVSADRLQRFLVKEDHAYRVTKVLREAVIFSAHDLLSDPPFSKIDLISCRNLLIYLESGAQAKVLSLLHFALQPDGYLFLGAAETIGQDSRLFKPVAARWRIYGSKTAARRLDVEFASTLGKRAIRRTLPYVPALPPGQLQAGELIRQELLALYAPAGVLVDHKHHVLYFYGATTAYLQPPDGAPNQAVLSLVRQELRPTLRQALRQAATASHPTVTAEAHLARDKALVPVKMTVHPVGEAAAMFLITFQDLPEEMLAPKKKRFGRNDQAGLIRNLEHDLKVMREELRKSIEEHESVTAELQAAHEEVLSANEELQSSNEELQSTNEELESANEELEASAEELQSANEELLTVNSQLENKVDELAVANDDLANLLSSTDIATLFVDRALNLRWFTPATTKVLDLRQSSIGQPITEVRARFTGTDLAADARRVLETLIPLEREVSGETHAYYICRVLPFRTADQRVGGIVITFIDITEQKQSERGIRRLADLVRDSNDAITVQDSRGRIVAWNQGAERTYGWSEREALSMNMTEIVPEDMRSNERQQMERLLRGESVPSFETQRLTKDGRRLDVWSTMTCLKEAANNEKLIATTDLAMQGESLQNMSRLLSSLLDITKLESGSVRPMLVDFPIRQVFEHLTATFAGEAGEKGLDLRIIATDAVAHSDPILLTQLLQNLVANAVRYTEKGFVEIRCVREGTYLRCEVADSGIGIPGHEVQSILEEFHEIGDDRQERRGGLGLGLAIVQRVAELLSTHIEVQSVYGQGSVFSVSVPTGRAGASALTEGKQSDWKTSTAACTLLLVGGNGAILAASKMLQKVKGFTVVTASSAAEAATRIKDLAAAPDVIVTDCSLGHGESGMDVVRSARVRAGYVIPAIVIAGDTTPKPPDCNIARVQTLHMPIDENDLMAAIRNALPPRH
jgi:two-component system, chemotaxis family, CheB/CheR fusion protein